MDQPQSPLGVRFRAIRPHRRCLRQAGHDPHHAPTPYADNLFNVNRNFLDRLLEPIHKVVESEESVVIPSQAPASLLRGAECGSPNTAVLPTAMACAIRVI